MSQLHFSNVVVGGNSLALHALQEREGGKRREEHSRFLLHSSQTCNGGLISKHVMYFTPTAWGRRGGGGWRGVGWRQEVKQEGGVYTGCPLSRYPHPLLTPLHRLCFISPLLQKKIQASPMLLNLTSPPLPMHAHKAWCPFPISSPPIAAPCWVWAWCGWGRVRSEVAYRKGFSLEVQGEPPSLPPRLTSCLSGCRKLFVHRNNASLFESSREKWAVLILSWSKG